MARISPGNTSEEILPVLSEAAAAAITQHNPSLVIEPFAILLIRLSNDASETANSNIRIQNRMIWITAIVLAVSLFQLGITCMQFLQSRITQTQATINNNKPTTRSQEPANKHGERNDTLDVATPSVIQEDKKTTPEPEHTQPP